MSEPPPRVLVVANPRSQGGATAKRLPDLERSLRRHGLPYELVCTTRRGHASEIAATERARACDVLAVVGGDGTLNEVAQAFVDERGEPRTGPDLAVIPSGSGGDFRRTLDLSGDLDEAIAHVRFGRRRACDLGVLHALDHAGRPIVRAFVNVASFGVGGQVDRIVDESPKWMGGRAVFFLGTLRALATFTNPEVRIRVDGAAFYEGKIFNVAIANGRYFGGGMKIAPHADPSDGRFEVVALGDLSRAEVLALSAKIYAGAHLGARGVSVGSGRVVEAEPVHPWQSVLLDVDGEAPGRLPARAVLLPGAITIRA